jgi:hypothetical protein
MKTSQDYPLQIDSVSVPDSTERIGMTFCPGKTQRGAMTGDWHRDLILDLKAIQTWGAPVIVNLMRDVGVTSQAPQPSLRCRYEKHSLLQPACQGTE